MKVTLYGHCCRNVGLEVWDKASRVQMSSVWQGVQVQGRTLETPTATLQKAFFAVVHNVQDLFLRFYV